MKWLSNNLWSLFVITLLTAGMAACGGESTSDDTDSTGEGGEGTEDGGIDTPTEGVEGTTEGAEGAEGPEGTGEGLEGEEGVEGEPTEGCETDDDCDVGFFCNADGDCEEEASEGCESDDDCGDGQFCNADSECEDEEIEGCESDDECGDGFVCEEGECVPVSEPDCKSDCDCGVDESCVDGFCELNDACEFGGEDCPCEDFTSSSDCDIGFFCDAAKEQCEGARGTCSAPCKDDADCESPLICNVVTGKCQAESCSADSQCGSDCCLGGTCGACPAVNVTSCVITSGDGVVTEGASRQLNAFAKGDGAERAEFTWTSSDPDAVAVDANGVITGGSKTGDATISAATGGTDCDNTVTIHNVAKAEAGKVSVSVIAATSGKGIADADVMVGAATCKTDASGTALCDGDGSMDITVMPAAYEWVTVIGGLGDAAKTNAVVYVLPNPDPASANKIGGFKGEFQYPADAVGEISFGLAGSSIKSLIDLDFDILVGESRDVQIECSSFSLNDTIPLPTGLVAAAPGLCEKLKADYAGINYPGYRAAWGIGGKLPLAELTKLINVLGPVIGGGGDLPIGQILAAILPLFAGFYHALEAGVEIPALDRLGDGSPDYDNFVGLDLNLDTKQVLLSTVTLPNLPNLGGTPVDGVLAIGGVMDRDFGMIPLGLTAGLDTTDEAAEPKDGVVNGAVDEGGNKIVEDGQMALTLAPQHGGIINRSYAYALLALPINSIDLSGGGINISGQIATVAAIEREKDFSGSPFLGFADGSTYDKAARKFTFAGEAGGASIRRISFEDGDGRNWNVYAPGAMDTVTVPAGTGRGTDEDASWRAELLRIPGGTTANDLINLGSGKNLDDLNGLMDGFSTFGAPQP